jgi:allantoinase
MTCGKRGGVAGIQATLPVLMTEGVWARLSFGIAHLTATAPAQLFGLYPAKVPSRRQMPTSSLSIPQAWTFQTKDLQTRSGVSAYLGRKFTGKVVKTIVRGKTVFADGEIVGAAGWGRFVRPRSPDISTIMDMSPSG